MVQLHLHGHRTEDEGQADRQLKDDTPLAPDRAREGIARMDVSMQRPLLEQPHRQDDNGHHDCRDARDVEQRRTIDRKVGVLNERIAQESRHQQFHQHHAHHQRGQHGEQKVGAEQGHQRTQACSADLPQSHFPATRTEAVGVDGQVIEEGTDDDEHTHGGKPDDVTELHRLIVFEDKALRGTKTRQRFQIETGESCSCPVLAFGQLFGEVGIHLLQQTGDIRTRLHLDKRPVGVVVPACPAASAAQEGVGEIGVRSPVAHYGTDGVFLVPVGVGHGLADDIRRAEQQACSLLRNGDTAVCLTGGAEETLVTVQCTDVQHTQGGCVRHEYRKLQHPVVL